MRVDKGIGFRPKNPLRPLYIYQRRGTTGVLKHFMDRTVYMDADRRRIWPKAIKSLDFNNFRTFTVPARDALTIVPRARHQEVAFCAFCPTAVAVSNV
jgi:hypothetical protein